MKPVMKFYQVKKDSDYQKDLIQARLDTLAVIQVSIQIRDEFGLPNEDAVSLSNAGFYQPVESIPDALKNQFKKDGFAKKNSEIYKRYRELIIEKELDDTKDIRFVNFSYDMLRYEGQTLKRFYVDNTDYIESDVEFSDTALQFLTPISEIEFRQIHLDALKADEAEKNAAKS